MSPSARPDRIAHRRRRPAVYRLCVRSFCAILLSGCATTSIAAQAPSDGAQDLRAAFAFLEDGKTTRDDVRAHLGPPSSEFKEGKIWTYSKLANGYHLVVVFGGDDTVATHEIVKVK